MRKKFIITLLVFFGLTTLKSQSNWLRYAGGTSGEETKDAIFDSNGDLVLTGFFNGNFNTGAGTLSSSGNTDIFILKSDDAGNVEWAVKAGGTGVDRANAIASDNNGNTYITGYIQGNASFGTINVTASGWDAYAAKIDQNGNFIWVTTFGGSFGDIGHGITVDNLGNVIVVGEYKGTATFGSDILTSMNSTSGSPTYDVFIAKLDNSGNFIWTLDGNANQDDRGLAVTTDANNSIYVVGQFSQTITFQNTHPTTLLNAGFIIGLDEDGNELWFDHMWGGQILIADIEWGGNNIYITGDYQNTLLIEDPGGVESFPATDQYNIFTARFDESGNLSWLSSNYSASELHVTQLVLDNSNNPYICGDFKCTFDDMNEQYGNSTFMSVGFEDTYFIKYNTTGNFQYARQAAGNTSDFCEGIAIKTNDKPVLAGYTEGKYYVPTGSTFNYLLGQQLNFFETNCGDNNYGNFAQTFHAGQRDIFWTCFYDANRDPFDYFEKNPGLACDLNVYEPCIGDEIPFNNCEDTLEGCSPVVAQLNDFMLGNIHPNYTVSWSNGGGGNSTAFTSPGYQWAITTTQDLCYTWTDSVFIVIHPNPDPPLISDSWNYNDYNAVTNSIDTCDADSVLVWATPTGSGDNQIIWSSGNELNDSTISVAYSGTYSAYTVNEFGCQSSANSIEIVINNFALDDVLDPHIIFNNSDIEDKDSTLTCNWPFCVSTHLIDSAFINVWGTLPNLVSVWYIDGVLVDSLDHNSDDSALVVSPTPINICASSPGWHVVEAHLLHECGDPTFYSVTDSFYVDIIPTPFLQINGPPSACPGDTIIISANFFTPTANWSGLQIIQNYGDSVMAVFSATTGINVSVSIDTTVQGITCYNSASYSLPFIPTPQVTVSPLDGVVCPGDSVMFTVLGGIAWQWIGPTGDSLGTNSTQYASDIGEYFCYVTTAEGCIVNSEFEAAVAYSSPSLYLWDPVICVWDSALIQVLGPTNTTINWLAPLSGSSFYEYAPTEGWYYCETSFCGITKIDSVFVEVSLPLEGFSMPNDTTICPYNSLIVNAPLGFAEYYWNGNLGSATFEILDSGFYYLNVVDTNGCTDHSDTLFVSYHALPNPPAASDTTVCPGTNALLNVTDGTGIYSWYNSSGTFLQNGNSLLVNSVLSNVNYFVTTADAFCESFADTATINVFVDNLIADFDIIDTCGSLNISVENTGTNGNHFWYFGDGATGNGSPEFHSYPGNGTYTISLVTTDPFCDFEDSTSQLVTLYGQSIAVNYNDPSCHGFSDASLTLNLIDGVGGETFLIEDISGNNLNIGGTNTANNLPGGLYIYTVTLGPGCALVDSVLIPDPPAIDADLNLYHPLCYGFTGSVLVDTVFNWQGNYNDISYFWAPNPAGVGGIGADSSYNMLAGTYVLTINDGNGCSNTISFEIVQPDPLTLVEFGTEPAYCRLYSYQSGNGVVYAAASGGTPDYDYLWINLGTGDTSDNSTWGGLNPGNYQIQVTDDNGCILIDEIVLDSLNPLADFDMSSLGFDIEFEGDAPLEVQFQNQSLYFANPNDPFADTTFFWNFNFDEGPWILSQDVNETFDTVYTAGTYTICLTAYNKNGCSDTLCQQIIVYDPVLLNPPNIFTPDGDGSNDEFTFLFLSQGIEIFECIVVNRWGVTVKEINDIHASWDGTDKNGDDCPDGVYFYVYKGSGFNGDEFQGQGSVTIVRGK